MRAKILLALCSVALTLGVLELLLARFAPQRTVDHVLANHAPMYRESDTQITELIPGFAGRERAHEGEYDVAITVNSLGYRQAEFNPRKQGQTRVVAIGDSFTFGHGVEGEEAWPRVLERELAARSARPVEVINAGVDGRWMDEYYLELKDRALALNPDLVVLGFFIGNDIDGEDARTHQWPNMDAQGRPLRIDAPDRCVDRGYRVQCVPQVRWRYPVIRNSHVAQMLFGAGRAIGDWWSPPQDPQDAVFAPQYPPETQHVIERVEDLFIAMRDLCRAHGAGFVVFMIPRREQLDARPPNGAAAWDWEKPQHVFAEFFRQHSIDYIDLLPVLRAAQTDGSVYFRYDAHWTVRGHVIAARALAEQLAHDGLVPASAQHAAAPPGAP